MQVDQANFGLSDFIPVEVDVVTSAQKGQLTYTASAIGSSVTLRIGGESGADVLQFVSGTAASAIAFAVNRITDQTGVTATQANGATWSGGVTFQSVGYGSRSFVSVSAVSGNFVVQDPSAVVTQRDEGGDAVATINGALTVGDGKRIVANTGSLDLSLELNETFGVGATSFAIVGGGALFQLGQTITPNQQVNLGIQSMAGSSLGRNGVGFLSDIVTGGDKSLVAGHPGEASEVIEASIRQVAKLRGRLGAFERNTLDVNVNSLSVALENVTASESTIRDADFARETAELTRAQILTQAGTSVLATANSSPQSVLSLLQ